MNIKMRLKQLVVLLLIVGMLLPLGLEEVFAFSGLTAYVETYGNRVNISGSTISKETVAVKINRADNNRTVYTNETMSDGEGNYSFILNLEGGQYKVYVSAVGLITDKICNVQNADSGTVTVRVEGKDETLLPEVRVKIGHDEINADGKKGVLTVYEAVTTALKSAGVHYESFDNGTGGGHSIGGIGPKNEGGIGSGEGSGISWQWMINGDGGQALPSQLLNEYDSIVLIPGNLYNPTLTKIDISAVEGGSDTTIAQNTAFVARLTKINFDEFGDPVYTPVEGQPVKFKSATNITDNKGEVIFTANELGEFYVSCHLPKQTEEEKEKEFNLIRPVPARLTVKTQGEIGGNNYVYLSVDAHTIGQGQLLTEQVEYKLGDTAYSVLERAIGSSNLKTTNGSMGLYVASMRFGGNWLGEFDHGDLSGWMINVNGDYIGISAGRYPVEPGDRVNWRYTTNLGADLGADMSSTLPKGNQASIDAIKNESIKTMLEKISSGNMTDKQIASEAEKVLKDVIANTDIDKIKPDVAKDLASDLTNAISIIIDIVNNVSELKAMIVDIIRTVGKLIGKMDSAAAENIEQGLSVMAQNAIDKKSVIEVNDSTIEVKANLMREINDFDNSVIKALLDTNLKLGINTVPEAEFVFNSGKIKVKTAYMIDTDRSLSLEKSNEHIELKLEPSLKSPVKIYTNTSSDTLLTVMMINGYGQEINIGGLYDEISGQMVFTAKDSGRYIIKKNKLSFKDLTNYSWAEEAVNQMSAGAIINGKSNESFDPSGKVTRAEIAAILVRAVKADGNTDKTFSDVNNRAWYEDYINKAVANNLMKGKTDGIFDPNGKITRQELAVAMTNVLSSYGFTSTGKKISFNDESDIAKWALEGVSMAAEYGLIKGNTKGEFNPSEQATRAEAVVMMLRLYKLIMK